MAHPVTEAASSPAPQSVAEKAAAFERDLGNFMPEEDIPPADEPEEEYLDGEELEGEELDGDELDEEVDEEGEEQEDPAIDAPVSLNAEEKAVFSQLPAEAQAAWAASETRRNTQVQEATTRASEAQRSAEQKAASAEREAEARFGEQLRQYTANFEPQKPDPARYADIQVYQRDEAIYQHQKAQHEELMQQVSGVGVETDEQKAARVQARDAEIAALPIFVEAEDKKALIDSAMGIAAELGYDTADLAGTMDAGDFQALAQAAKWKADSEELASIKSKAKTRRRDKGTGRFKSLKPGAAPQPSSRAVKADKAFGRVKSNIQNKQKFGEASADWLETQGIKL